MSDYPSPSTMYPQTDLDPTPASHFTPPYSSTMSTNGRSSFSSPSGSLCSDSDETSPPAHSRDPIPGTTDLSHKHTHTRPDHLLSSYVDGMSPLRCPKCPEEFMMPRFLNLHLHQIHHRLPAHHCPHCRGPYATTKDLNDHILCDHRSEPRPYKCDKCPCSYSTHLSLRLHMAETHTHRIRSCDECGYQTRFEKAFLRHMKDVHAVSIELDIGDNGYHAQETRTIGFISTHC